MHEIITELGGHKVHIKQITALTKQKAPIIYANKLMHKDLERLRVWGYVDYDAQKRIYTILEPFPEANVYFAPIDREGDEN